ncbi:putative DNA-directed RNA polymerase ii subunit rpb1 protein [Rosellinia necatrix]|uniref:Putative DNA-directed RNA polymerase ii subunit rpb1 protein n=1 Tax=Rosellinia necatrix TaxID=77044 RepID=A0A1W2TBR6_ROSNE|nr:putative DNA-directed RNA polymerase ii subunit rpb1 protein [Rosellinia necatrix]
MNAHALLTSQGWRGTGHSLHPTSDSTGLTHHILIKRNQDGSGLGSKKDHKQEAWWLNAFDQALKGIDMKSGTMKQTLKGGALEKITARKAATKYTGARGLYTSFVRGGVLEGSANDPAAASLPTPPDSGVSTPLATGPGGESSGREETKEERRARRAAKKLKKAEKEAHKQALKQAAEKVEKKKAKKAERKASKEIIKATETKEERRTRRQARRRRKEKKRLMKAAKT